MEGGDAPRCPHVFVVFGGVRVGFGVFPRSGGSGVIVILGGAGACFFCMFLGRGVWIFVVGEGGASPGARFCVVAGLDVFDFFAGLGKLGAGDGLMALEEQR